MKIIGLIGEPAAGKSTVMKNLISELGEGSIVKEGLVVYTLYPEDKVVIAGKYEEGVTFCGTDTLSKGCGPKYREQLSKMDSDSEWDDYTFYWEGERFSNSKFFDFFYSDCKDVTTYYLEAGEDVLNARNASRSNQNETWRKGMRTRMHNLRQNYPVKVVQQGFSLSVSQ
jgi:ABC-type dipeptide/oligopeptide/nickel transport system ATPase component